MRAAPVPARRTTATDIAWYTAWCLIMALAVGRVLLTYGEYTQTWDEPVHVAADLEWIERGDYTIEPMHPPLARIAVALEPYLDGRRLPAGITDKWEAGNAVLHQGGAYERTLTLARLGVLPFFLIAAVACLLLGNDVGGRWTGTVSLLLFTLLPTTLAHAGLATTDMALTALLTLTLLLFLRWQGRPSDAGGAAFGAAAGATFLSKLSALLFLPAALLAATLLRPRRRGIAAQLDGERGGAADSRRSSAPHSSCGPSTGSPSGRSSQPRRSTRPSATRPYRSRNTATLP